MSGSTNGILHGDLGYSITSGEKVNDQIIRAALPTFILAGVALVIWIGFAIVIGVYSAIKRYSLFDNASTVFAYVGFAIPTFWLGIMLVYIFGTSKILPVSGMVDIRVSPAFGNDAYWVYFGQHPIDAILDVSKHLILPVVTLVVVNIAGDSRFVRASMLDALNQDYVRTAKAKGLPGRTVTFKHALRNALLPVVTNIGLEIPFLFTGAIITETIFSWPGIGKLTIDATTQVRLPGPHGGPADHLADRRARQPHRGRRLRDRRSAHQVLGSDDGTGRQPDRTPRGRGRRYREAPGRGRHRLRGRPRIRSASTSWRGGSSGSTAWP